MSNQRTHTWIAAVLVALATVFAFAVPAFAREEIRSFTTETELRTDGSVEVTETIAVNVEGDHVSVTREVDGGLETVKLKLPAIVTTDLRLNEPRYASLPNIMKAKSKPLDTKSPADYGVDTAPRVKTVKVSEPPVRSAGVKVADVDELVAKLKAMGVHS